MEEAGHQPIPQVIDDLAEYEDRQRDENQSCNDETYDFLRCSVREFWPV
jgi:hypothetical protein